MSQNALNLVLQSNTATKDTLAEQWGVVFENLAKSTVSMLYKNQDVVSGDAVNGGVLHFRRYANADMQAYGTAREAGKGRGLQAQPIAININDDKELIEEIQEKDLRLCGFSDLVTKRTLNQESAMRRYYERKFFNTGVLAGTVHTIVATKIEEKLEEVIQKVEAVQNDFVDGVERDNIVLFVTPAVYGLARGYMDTVSLPNVTAAVGEFGMFHGVIVHSSIYLPATVDYVVMAKGSVAQPIIQNIQEPIIPEFSNAIAFGMYLYAGHGAVMSDLIFFAGTLGTVTAISADGAAGETTKTVITVTSAKSDAANDFYYLSGASAVAAPAYGTAVGATWTKLVLTEGAQKITTGTDTKIRVAEADASGRIIKCSAEITIEYVGA